MKTGQDKVRIVARSRDGFSAIVQSTQPRSPRREEGDSIPTSTTEKICQVCGEPKTAHEPGCHMAPFSPPIALPAEPSGSTLNPQPATGHVCMASGCGTLIDAEDNFCEYHFQKLPADLLWLYVKSGPDARKLALQSMVDHFDPARSGDGPSPDLKSQLLRECFEFLNLMGREEIFRCVDCHCDRTIFIDDEQANRFDTLLNRVEDATKS